jgi:heat shock 70kDa protein 4
MEVKAHGWDRSLGGRDLDTALVAHFAEQFKAKTGLNILENAKARFRMAAQVTRCRQMLTSNPEAPISVECLMEDTDFRCVPQARVDNAIQAACAAIC